MGLQLTVPYPVGGPREGVLALLPEGAGGVLDGGRTWSKTGEGELVVTSRGLIACDPASGEMTGMPWSGFDAARQLFDCDSYACIAMNVPGYGELAFGIDYRLAANIWAIASQLGEAGPGAEVDRVVTSAGLSAIHEPADEHLVEGPVNSGGVGDPVVAARPDSPLVIVPTVAEPPPVEPPSIEPPRSEPPRLEPLRLEPPRSEQGRVVPPSVDPVAFETLRVVPPIVEPPRVEPTGVGGVTGEPSPARSAEPDPPSNPGIRYLRSDRLERPTASTGGPSWAEPVGADGSEPGSSGWQTRTRGDRTFGIPGVDPQAGRDLRPPPGPEADTPPAWSTPAVIEPGLGSAPGTGLPPVPGTEPSPGSPTPPSSSARSRSAFGSRSRSGSAPSTGSAFDSRSGAGSAPSPGPAAGSGSGPGSAGFDTRPVVDRARSTLVWPDAPSWGTGTVLEASPPGDRSEPRADPAPAPAAADPDPAAPLAEAWRQTDRIDATRMLWPPADETATPAAPWGATGQQAAAPRGVTDDQATTAMPWTGSDRDPSDWLFPADGEGEEGPGTLPRRRPLRFEQADHADPGLHGFQALVHGPGEQRRLWFWAGGAVALALIVTGLMFVVGRDGHGSDPGQSRVDAQPAGPVASITTSLLNGNDSTVTTATTAVGPSATAGAPLSTAGPSPSTAGGAISTAATPPPVKLPLPGGGSATTAPATVTSVAPTSVAPTSAAASCHPAYRPCLPNRPGDALSCADIAANLKPITVIDPAVDPYKLQGSARSGKAC